MKWSLFTLLLTSFSINLTAQVDMVWDDYGLGFTLPRGLSITENDGDTFSAESDDLYLTILPIADRTITEDDLADAVVAMATEMEYDELTDADDLELNDLYGYYVEGEKDGARAFVIAMMDSQSATNFLAVIVFSPGRREQAMRLARSFYAYE
ncbi:MAG: hypothetical protein K9I85_15160 [Saprospiraceae bacterium]|nr:hypothetical protein [Saprospiraceae bacterium]